MSRQVSGLEVAMTARRTKILIGSVGLLVALATTMAPGAIQPRATEPPPGPVDRDLLQSYTTQLLDSDQFTADLTGPVSVPTDPSPNDDSPPTLEEVEDLLAALPAGCQPSSISHSSGSGFANSAIPSATCDVPRAARVARLLDEIQLAFANPPPSGPLRPPR